MKIAKPTKRLLVSILVVSAVVFLFFFRMYRDDIKTITGFMASYEQFDKAVSFYADKGRPDGLGKANEALIELQARASLRLSSLIKNDGELMDQAREVADLSRRELEGLKMEDHRLLHEKRIAAYARFQELSGRRR